MLTPSSVLAILQASIANGQRGRVWLLARSCRRRARVSKKPAWLAIAHAADAGLAYMDAPAFGSELLERKIAAARRLA